MRNRNLVLLVALTCALSAWAGGAKQKGKTSLKDLQPAGDTDKKKKNQQYDFTLVVSGTQYTCRTSYKDKLKATDFPVGGDITYEIDGDKGKVKNAKGKGLNCTIVRVEKLPDSAGPSATPQSAPAPQ